MSRISVRGLRSLNLGTAQPSCSARAPFARAFSTTAAARDLRSKLWKDGQAPGAEDPYTQRPDVEEAPSVPQEVGLSKTIRRSVPRSRLALPPKRTEATTEKQLTANDPTYTPATSLEDLEETPTLKNWWEQPGHWGEENNFRGFAKAGKVEDKDVLEVHLRRAVIEVLALEKSGQLSEWATKKWPEGGREILDMTLAVNVNVSADGKASLVEDISSLTSRLTSGAVDNVVPEKLTHEEAKQLVAAWDPSWKNLIVNQEVKFAVRPLPLVQKVPLLTLMTQLRKRLYQLTGNLVSDAKLGAARTVKNILTVAAKQPKPTKLAEILETKTDLGELANVRIHSKKIGPIYKEIEVGRWKVIEEELKKRGLPVKGTDGLSGHRERDWMRQNY